MIGSKALSAIGVSLPRQPKDNDYIAHPNNAFALVKMLGLKHVYTSQNAKKLIGQKDNVMYEIELAWHGSTGDEFLQLIGQDSMNTDPIDYLYALKMSHRFLKNSPHFLKTMRDVQLMKKLGAKIRPEHMDWFKRREKETYNYGHPKLNTSKKEFFNPNMGVKYTYDHDSIHQCMAHLGAPAYTLFKADKAEVKCSKDLFHELSFTQQLFSVLEETQVLALERSQIPFPHKDPKWSFDKALEKVCTSISSGWWRDFAYDNYDKVQSMYEQDYAQRFWKGVETGIVKKLDTGAQKNVDSTQK